MALPAGVSVVDAGAGQVSGGALGFAFPLAADEDRTVRFWVRLPSQPGTLVLQRHGDGGLRCPGEDLRRRVSLVVAPTPSLEQLEAQLDALIDSGHPNGTALGKAATLRHAALASSDRATAIREVLQATDVLVGLSAPEVTEARVALDTWLRWATLGSP